MPLLELESWWAATDVLKRRGRPDIQPGWERFTPGSVKPLGYRDQAAGLGQRNVGPRITTFTPWYGDYYLTPGAQVSGLEIFGRLIGQGNASTYVSDCIIHGRTNSVSAMDAAVQGTNTSGAVNYNLGGVVFEWCRFEVTSNKGFTDVVDGGNYTIRYSELYGGVDAGGMMTTGNGRIECCRIGYGYYTSWWDDAAGARRTTSYTDVGGTVWDPPFPGQSSGDTHSDGAQIQQYSGWVLRGNYIGGTRNGGSAGNLDPTVSADYTTILARRGNTEYYNAAVIISSASAGNKVGALIEKNWLHGGQARLNIAWKSYDDMSGVQVLNNRFVRSTYGFYIYLQTNCAAVLSGNVMDDNGDDITPVFF